MSEFPRDCAISRPISATLIAGHTRVRDCRNVSRSRLRYTGKVLSIMAANVDYCGFLLLCFACAPTYTPERNFSPHFLAMQGRVCMYVREQARVRNAQSPGRFLSRGVLSLSTAKSRRIIIYEIYTSKREADKETRAVVMPLSRFSFTLSCASAFGHLYFLLNRTVLFVCVYITRCAISK